MDEFFVNACFLHKTRGINMENTMRVSASAVSVTGAAREKNTNRIYTNGKFNNSFDNDNIRISLELSDTQLLFALSDGMELDGDAPEKNEFETPRPISDYLDRFLQKYKNDKIEFREKLDELYDYICKTGYLMNDLNMDEFEKNAAHFAGLMFDNGKYAAVNFGNYKIYKFEEGLLNSLTGDGSTEGDNLPGNGRPVIDVLQTGDTFLICSKGITDVVNENSLHDIISSNQKIDEAATVIVKQAVRNNGSDNLTAIIIRIENVKEQPGAVLNAAKAEHSSFNRRKAEKRIKPRKKEFDFSGLVSAAVILVIIAAVALGAAALWMNMSRNIFNDDSNFVFTEGESGHGEGSSVDPNRGEDNADENSGDEGDVSGENSSNSGAKNGLGSGDSDYGSDSGSVSDSDSGSASGSPSVPGSVSGGGNERSGVSGSKPSGSDSSAVYEIIDTYEVKEGDTLSTISQKYYGSQTKYEMIMKANGLENDRISIGQILKIPKI